MTAEHVVFGTGGIGLATAAALLVRGERVPMVNRSGSARVPDDVEVVTGDAADPGFTTAVAAGARVVYQTLNPPSHRWPEQFPSLQAGVLAAAPASGARLVSIDNVYGYGREAGRGPKAVLGAGEDGAQHLPPPPQDGQATRRVATDGSARSRGDPQRS